MTEQKIKKIRDMLEEGGIYGEASTMGEIIYDLLGEVERLRKGIYDANSLDDARALL